MCGIWGLLGLKGNEKFIKFDSNYYDLISDLKEIYRRGPDAFGVRILSNDIMTNAIAFVHLPIVAPNGMQPLTLSANSSAYVVCNGEIYNYKQLQKEHNFSIESQSDVEVILHLYHKFGIEKTIKSLDGEFAFCLVDLIKNKIFFGRDPYGVRPLYTFYNPDEQLLGFASESKALLKITQLSDSTKYLKQFDPGHFEVWNSSFDFKYKKTQLVLENKTKYFSHTQPVYFDPFTSLTQLNQLNVYDKISLLLENACRKRIFADKSIACLLSGGLDSSLVTALTVKLAKELNFPYQIETFSIGMKDSPDLKAAKLVADHLNTKHQEIIFDEKDIERVLKSVIYTLGTYDITTIRASIPMYLLGEYIKKNSKAKVILSGEGSDEVTQGYLYFHKSPNTIEAHNESLRLLNEIHLYDGLRADRCISAHGLELRLPFLDLEFVQHYLNLDINLISPNQGIEKWLLRKSFEDKNLIPSSILWRKKEALSDGVTHKENSLFNMIHKMACAELFNVCVTNSAKNLDNSIDFSSTQDTQFINSVDSELNKSDDTNLEQSPTSHNLDSSFTAKNAQMISESPNIDTSFNALSIENFNEFTSSVSPQLFISRGLKSITKEAFYYKYIFDQFYPNMDHLTLSYWMPRWVQVNDPSARFLSHY